MTGKKKKVLLLVPSLSMGGMERVCVNYANLFSRRGYDVTLLNFTYDDSAIVGHLSKNVRYQAHYQPVKNLLRASITDIIKMNFRILPWHMWIKIHSAKYLYKKYIKEKYDIEIAFFGSESIKIISGSTNCDAKKFGWIHNLNIKGDIRALGTYRRAKKVYHKIENIICVSEKAKGQFTEIFDRRDQVYVINNPNDTQTIRLLAEDAEECFVKERFTLVNVSRFVDHQKGYTRLLNVCKKLCSEGIVFDLWLVGDGADFEKIQNTTKEYELNNVYFWGKQGNPYKFIKNADLYVCASYTEGFSMVMMEAVILGVPMLSTNVSGASEMLGDGKYGMIVENSEDGLYKGLKELILDRKLYAHYKMKAEERKDYLSEEVIMDKLEQIINNSEDILWLN